MSASHDSTKSFIALISSQLSVLHRNWIHLWALNFAWGFQGSYSRGSYKLEVSVTGGVGTDGFLRCSWAFGWFLLADSVAQIWCKHVTETFWVLIIYRCSQLRRTVTWPMTTRAGLSLLASLITTQKNWRKNSGEYWCDRKSAVGQTTNPADNTDMISPAFWSVNGTEFKITRSDDSSHTALLYTTGDCLGGQTFRSVDCPSSCFQVSRYQINCLVWEEK